MLKLVRCTPKSEKVGLLDSLKVRCLTWVSKMANISVKWIMHLTISKSLNHKIMGTYEFPHDNFINNYNLKT